MARPPKNAKSIGFIVALCAVAASMLWAVIAVLIGYLANGGSFGAVSVLPALVSGMTDYRVWVLWFCVCAGIGVVIAIREMRSSRRVLKINDIEDKHWLTDKEIRKSDDMTIAAYSKLDEVSDGMPVYARRQGDDVIVVLQKPIHTLTIGTTGSGKTSGFVEPVVQILSHTKTKPCIVLSDPKGELYRHNAATLEAQGYKVLVIDIASPYTSARWNPFGGVIEKTHRVQAASKSDVIVQDRGKYVFDDKTYLTHEQADSARKVLVQSLTDEIFIDLQDVIHTICPITSQQEPVWEQGARNFILALAVAMWEDMRDGACDEKEFNLFSLYRNISDYADENLEVITEYLSERDEFSLAPGLAKTVLVSTDRTRSSYLSQVSNYMVQFADTGICALTAENDVELDTFDEQPTALFLKIPDEKENRHFIATIIITQLYKILVEKARQNYKRGETNDEYLKRNVYVILDEFGNMPKFPSVDKIITVGRSRKIFMCPIIQDYNQLENKYGKDLAGTIKSNCNIKVFIGSTDNATIEDFSKLCGKTKQRHISFSDGMSDDRFSVSTSAESVPLIYPSELQELNDPPNKMGNAVVLTFGKPPLRATFEPVFKSKAIYKVIDNEPNETGSPIVFDAQGHFYNFYSRNLWLQQSAALLERQQAEVERLLSTADEDVDDVVSDTFFENSEIFLKYIQRIRARCLTKPGRQLETAFSERNLPKALEYLESIISWAQDQSLRFLIADASRLKVLLLSIKQKVLFCEQATELDARASPDVE